MRACTLGARVADTTGGIVIRDRRGQRRDPTASTINTGISSPGRAQIPEWDSYAAFKSAYLANVYVYRCVEARATALSALPLRVGADPSKPKDFDPKAPLAQLLGPPPGGPNPTTTARRLIAWMLTQKIVSGRYGLEMERDRAGQGRPFALWPLPSSSLRAIPSDGGRDYFKGYEFGPANKKKTLRTDQVMYAWNPDPTDWREPLSALQAARLDVSVAIMQNRYDYAFLKNDARPAAIIVTEEFAEDDEYDRFKNQMLSEHRGPDNAGKLAFLEADASNPGGVAAAFHMEQLGLSHVDAQFVQREEAKIRAICIALKVPLSKLGDASRRTFNNAGQEHINFELDAVVPDAVEMEDEINLLLAPLIGDGLVAWFDRSSLTSAKVSRFAPVGLVEAFKAGIVDEDEARAELDFESRDTPTPQPAAAEAVEAPLSLLERTQAFKNLCDAGLTEASAGLLAGLDVTVIEPKPKPTPPPAVVSPVVPAAEALAGSSETREADSDDRAAVGEARRAATWAAMDARATALEHMYTGVMDRLFARQAASTLSRLNGKRGRQLLRDLTDAAVRAPGDPAPDAGDLFDEAHWQTETEQAVLPLYESTAAQGGLSITSRFGGVFDIASTAVQEFIHARANQLAGQVTSTTYGQIQTALADGLQEGLGIDELAAAVRHVFDIASSSRAEMIARTEVLSAYNGAQDLQAALLPADVVAGKEWIATRDDRTRDTHSEADGLTVTISDPFAVGGQELQYPGDPNGAPENIINCRCTVGYLTPDEMPTVDAPERGAVQLEYRHGLAVLRQLVAA